MTAGRHSFLPGFDPAGLDGVIGVSAPAIPGAVVEPVATVSMS
ncbi:hypothetical protein [Streptomyces sp. NPDC004726]